METITREEWLTAAIVELGDWFAAKADTTIPRVRVSVGFPAGVRGGNGERAIGQCWQGANVADRIAAIFISPVLDDSVTVLATLTHELAHAVTPGQGHRGGFAVLARKLGLVGKLTATTAGEELRAELTRIAAYLGDYRDIHGAIDPNDRKKQGTRMLKAYCGLCDFIARVTAKNAANAAHYCDVRGALVSCLVDLPEAA